MHTLHYLNLSKNYNILYKGNRDLTLSRDEFNMLECTRKYLFIEWRGIAFYFPVNIFKMSAICWTKGVCSFGPCATSKIKVGTVNIYTVPNVIM